MPELTTEVALNILTGCRAISIAARGSSSTTTKTLPIQQCCCLGLNVHFITFVISTIFSFCNRPVQINHRTVLITYS